MPVIAALLAFQIAAPPLVLPKTLTDLGSKYRVEIRVLTAPLHTNHGYQIDAAAVSQEALDRYAPLFILEWNRYPTKVMSKVKLKTIIIGTQIAVEGQFRAAIPATDANTMYYDAVLGFENPSYQRGVVHHEFFHMMDEQMGLMRVDKEWSSLNPPEFKYGTGGEFMRDKHAGVLTTKLPGLLTAYSGSAVEEDKAEIFSHLIIHPDFVGDRVAADPIMAKKVEFLKKRMKAFDAGFNNSFWPLPSLK